MKPFTWRAKDAAHTGSGNRAASARNHNTRFGGICWVKRVEFGKNTIKQSITSIMDEHI